MPLAISSPAGGNFPDSILSTNTECVGAVTELDITVTRAEGISAGDTLYVEINYTDQNGLPLYLSSFATGFWGLIPQVVATSSELSLLSNEVSRRAFAPTSVEITRAGATTIDINIQFFHHQEHGLLGDVDADELDNQMIIPSQDSAGPTDFSPNMVYREERTMVINVGFAEASDPSTVTEEVQFKKDLRASYWNRDLDGVLDTPISDVTFKLSIAGVPVSEISTSQATLIEITFTCSAFTPDDAGSILGIFKPGVAGSIIGDKKLSAISFPAGPLSRGVDSSAFLGISLIQSLGGDVYRAGGLLDPTYFTEGETWAIYYASSDSGAAFHRSILSDVNFSVNDTPLAATGDITTEGMTYDRLGKVWPTDCLQNVVPEERVRLCFQMDIATYNSEILSNGGTGDFDQNFVGGRLIVDDHWPGTQQEIFNNSSTIELNSFSNDGSTAEYCYEERIPAVYAGMTIYVSLVWIFRIELLDGTIYFDYIVTPYELGVRDFEPDNDSGAIAFVGFQDVATGDPLSVLQCQGAGNINAVFEFQHPNPQEYSFIPLLFKNGAATDHILENDRWINPNLPLLDAGQIIFNEIEFDAVTRQATATIDTSALDLDTEYCVAGIAKGYDDGLPPDPTTPASCPQFDVEIDLTTDNATSSQFDLTVDINITNISIGGFVVSNIRAQVNAPNLNDYYLGTFQGTPISDTISGVEDGGGASRSVMITLNIQVEIDDGADYCRAYLDAAIEVTVTNGETILEELDITNVLPDAEPIFQLPDYNGFNIRIIRNVDPCADVDSYIRQDCRLTIRDCEGTPNELLLTDDTPWNCQLCQTDAPFSIPYYRGAKFMLQTRFVDILSPDPTTPTTPWGTGWVAELYDSDGNLVTDNFDLFASRYLAAWDGRGSYQVIEIDTSLDQFNFLDCWSVKIIALDSEGNNIGEYVSHHFRETKSMCDRLVWIEGLYENYDCYGQYYGDPVGVITKFEEFRYTNAILAPFHVLDWEDTFEKTIFSGKTVVTELSRTYLAAMQEIIAPFFKNYISRVILPAQEVYFDEQLYEIDEFTLDNKLNTGTRMFLFDIQLIKSCRIDHRCGDLPDPTSRPIEISPPDLCVDCLDSPCVEDPV